MYIRGDIRSKDTVVIDRTARSGDIRGLSVLSLSASQILLAYTVKTLIFLLAYLLWYIRCATLKISILLVRKNAIFALCV